MTEKMALTCGNCGALGGTRTPNLLIRSQMLYPLSYECSLGLSYLRFRRFATDYHISTARTEGVTRHRPRAVRTWLGYVMAEAVRTGDREETPCQ
jgi:hypothetical protein